MTDKAAPKTVKTQETPYLDKLVDKYGSAETCNMIGLSKNGLSNYKTEGTRPAYEMAAELIWTKENGPRRSLHYVVEVPDDKKDLFKTFLKGLECRFMEWRM